MEALDRNTGSIGGADSLKSIKMGVDLIRKGSFVDDLIGIKEIIILILLMVSINLIVNFSLVSNAGNDPRTSLLVSQSIIDYKTIRLDNYKNVEEKYGYTIRIKNNHFYYYFPLGTSISSIPFVLFERYFFKKNMYNSDDEYATQRHIVSLVSAFIFLFLFLIANHYLSASKSLVVSSVFWFGTSLSSTLGTALWSHDFGCLYSLIAIYLAMQIKDNKINTYWILIPICLFMAYLTRPTLSLFSFVLIPYISVFNRKIAIKTAVILSCLLGLFVLFSLHEFGQILPDYYMPKRLSGGSFWIAFYGNLFSPARGLFIYSPFLLLFFINYKAMINLLRTNKELILFLIWIILHLVMISMFPHWWGGYSYGPRFMSDTLPGIFVLFAALLNFKQSQNIFVTIIMFLLVVFSIYVHVIQGMFNTYSDRWNDDPNIDKNPIYLFDWEYPQFLHNEERHNERLLGVNKNDIANIDFFEEIYFNSPKVFFWGWSTPETIHRWSLGNSSKIIFKVSDTKGIAGILTLHIRTLGKQVIDVKINGHYIGSQENNGEDNHITYQFDPKLLKENDINKIYFKYSNPHKPNNGDPRVLAMQLKSFRIG